MKKLSAIFGILIVATLAGYGGYYSYLRFAPHENPDPNHMHIDLAVWVGSTQMNFNRPEWMSGLSTDANHDNEVGFRKFIHLHDNVAHVVHFHKPGQTIGDFFVSLGMEMTKECLAVDADHRDCTNEAQRWRMFVNSAEAPFDPVFAPADGDKILLSYETGDMTIEDQLRQMTDDACRYSKTCPWKGAPPTENCIADPEVPCVQ